MTEVGPIIGVTSVTTAQQLGKTGFLQAGLWTGRLTRGELLREAKRFQSSKFGGPGKSGTHSGMHQNCSSFLWATGWGLPRLMLLLEIAIAGSKIEAYFSTSRLQAGSKSMRILAPADCRQAPPVFYIFLFNVIVVYICSMECSLRSWYFVLLADDYSFFHCVSWASA